MIKRILKTTLCWITMLSLVMLTTVALFIVAVHIIAYSFSRPQPISGKVWSAFTIVAMNGNKPAELIHEWSGGMADYLRSSNFANQLPKPVVWAKTGKADGPFRYYLTDADLLLVNSKLNSKFDEYPHSVKVIVLKNDCVNKIQTLQVTVSGDDTDVINVYNVEKDHIHPIKWKSFRGRVVGFAMVPLTPFILVGSAWLWMRLLRERFSSYMAAG